MTDKSILLVEDNPLDARFIIKAFESSDIQNSIVTVHNGEEAVRYVMKQGIFKEVQVPGVMLLDLKMPKKGGLEVLEDLKKYGLLKKITVIVITTSDSGVDLKKCRDFGVKKFITKPLEINEFTMRIREIEPILLKAINGKK